MDFILDTNILVYFVRDDRYIHQANEQLALFSGDNYVFVSIVSVGEIRALAYKFGWGNSKKERLEQLLISLNPFPVDGATITQAYAEIDAFSQGDHPALSMPVGATSRNMGKNDLWIAATTYIMKGVLVTNDPDFNHLAPDFFQLRSLTFR